MTSLCPFFCVHDTSKPEGLGSILLPNSMPQKEGNRVQRGKVFPQGHMANKLQTRASTLASHRGVCHWVGRQVGFRQRICAFSLSLPLPWPVTPFSVLLLQRSLPG